MIELHFARVSVNRHEGAFFFFVYTLAYPLRAYRACVAWYPERFCFVFYFPLFWFVASLLALCTRHTYLCQMFFGTRTGWWVCCWLHGSTRVCVCCYTTAVVFFSATRGARVDARECSREARTIVFIAVSHGYRWVDTLTRPGKLARPCDKKIQEWHDYDS